MEWSAVFNKIKRSVLKIETPYGQGTGFFLRHDKGFVIATAYHVVSEFDKWGGPIDFITYDNNAYRNLGDECKIIGDPDIDAALMKPTLVPTRDREDVSMSSSCEDLLDLSNVSVTAGTEVGWIGFPGAIPEKSPSAFVGRVSFANSEILYINGTVLTGLSGSPVFILDEHNESPQVIGVVTHHLGPNYEGDPVTGLGGVVPLKKLLSQVLLS